jgi:hypothetical protein
LEVSNRAPFSIFLFEKIVKKYLLKKSDISFFILLMMMKDSGGNDLRIKNVNVSDFIIKLNISIVKLND